MATGNPRNPNIKPVKQPKSDIPFGKKQGTLASLKAALKHPGNAGAAQARKSAVDRIMSNRGLGSRAAARKILRTRVALNENVGGFRKTKPTIKPVQAKPVKNKTTGPSGEPIGGFKNPNIKKTGTRGQLNATPIGGLRGGPKYPKQPVTAGEPIGGFRNPNIPGKTGVRGTPNSTNSILPVISRSVGPVKSSKRGVQGGY